MNNIIVSNNQSLESKSTANENVKMMSIPNGTSNNFEDEVNPA